MNKQFTIKVFFRGDWCPWCNAYLRDFDNTIDKINTLGGHVVGITSQLNNQSKANNNLSFDVVVDNENIDAQKYDIFITSQNEVPNPNAIDSYAHGMVQPGVIIEDSNGNILYRWAINPNKMNFGGATDRPLVSDIVNKLEKIIEGSISVDADTFGTTDIAYLEQGHPVEFKQVKAYLDSIS